MTEEMKYYTGNCITDLHTDTYNKEKCKQYTKSDGLNFCMSSVCPEKDCIYALVYKLHQKIDRLEQENNSLQAQLNNITVQSNNAITALEQENKELKKQHYETLKMLKHEYDGRQRDNEQWFTRCSENHNEDSKIIDNYRSALEEIREMVTSPYPGEPRDVLNIINEVLNDK